MTDAKFGVALGGGGVRGLAHIVALQAIDSCGVKPSVIAGTSMGAIIGALYASGISGEELYRKTTENILSRKDSFREVVGKAPKISQWLRVIKLNLHHGTIFKADRFLQQLSEIIKVKTFEELEIPLHIVTTNFWTGEEVVLSSGELLPAIGASMAIPGIFSPVTIDNQILVDGGLCNNLPVSVLHDKCNTTIAIDVAPNKPSDDDTMPGLSDSIIRMFDLMVEKAVDSYIRKYPPDIYVHAKTNDISVLDFHKSGEVLRQAATAAAELKTKLQAKLAETHNTKSLSQQPEE